MPKSVIATINGRLRELGRKQRLVRDVRGYYYVSNVACSSALWVYRLESGQDEKFATEHVETVLTREDGKPFTLFEETVQ